MFGRVAGPHSVTAGEGGLCRGARDGGGEAAASQEEHHEGAQGAHCGKASPSTRSLQQVGHCLKLKQRSFFFLNATLLECHGAGAGLFFYWRPKRAVPALPIDKL